MIPVKQTLVGGGRGNCLPACIASILEIGIDDVPNFCEGQDDGRWLDRMADWLTERGLCAVHCCFVDRDPGPVEVPGDLEFIADWLRRRRIGLAIVNGYTERGLSHATVWEDGVLVHDPHPKPSPLLNVVSVIVLAQRDPVQRRVSASAHLAERHKLTSVEQRILYGVLAGHTSNRIAEDLEISRATVKWHMHNLFAKTGAMNREGLLRLALG